MANRNGVEDLQAVHDRLSLPQPGAVKGSYFTSSTFSTFLHRITPWHENVVDQWDARRL